MTAEYYNLLGISYEATPVEIRAAYFDAVRRLHPDVNPDPKAQEQFLEIQEAYEILSDSEKRQAYDKSLPDNAKIPLTAAMNIRVSRSVIPALSEPQLVYALIDLNCTGEPDPSKLPSASICLVIDRSTSMKGERIEMVKYNILQIIKHFKRKDMI